jgi:Thioredoxin
MQIVLIALVIGAIAALIAVAAKQRKPEAPTQATYESPQQLDRADFVEPTAPWLVVLFISDTCHTCAGLVPKVQLLASDTVAVEVSSFQSDKTRHERYHIEAVPTTLLADGEGVVVKTFVGPVSATDLWAAMAELREPGSTPPPEAHQPL